MFVDHQDFFALLHKNIGQYGARQPLADKKVIVAVFFRFLHFLSLPDFLIG
jgi:hypothetical protein